MSIWLVITAIACHFYGDWYLQSRDTAINKSKDPMYLVIHLTQLSVAMIPLALFLPDRWVWVPTYIVLHGIQDWFLWRVAKRWVSPYHYWENKRFYDTIAFDQALHLVTLFLCLEYIP